MVCRFILGKAGSGKTHYCLSSIAAALAEQPMGKPLVFILPEQATFIHERKLAMVAPGGGFCRADVTSFRRLIYKAIKEGGGQMPPSLSDSGRLLLMSRLLRQHRPQLHAFGSRSLQSGFVQNLVSVSEEMQVYGVDPQIFADYVAKMAEEAPNSNFAHKLTDTALLYSAYSDIMLGSYGSYPDAMDTLIAAIMEKGFLNQATIYIDGYSDFTPKEVQVIAVLMAKAERVEITLDIDPDLIGMNIGEEDVFHPIWRCYGRLAEAAEYSGGIIEPPLCLNGEQGRFAAGEEMALLEKRFANRAKVAAFVGEPQNIKIYHASTMRSELQGIGREIIRLTREQGLRYRQIAIIARDSSPYQHLLPQIFADMQIPYFIDSKKPLLYHPLVELMRAALEIWAYNLRHENIFRYLKNQLSPLTAAETDCLENYCLANGCKFWSWGRIDCWTGKRGLPADTADLQLTEIDQLRRRGSAALLNFCAVLGKEAEIGQIVAALHTLLDVLAVEQQIADWAEQARAAGQGADAELHQQAWARIMDFLTEAELLLAGVHLDAPTVLNIFDAALSGLTVSMIPPGLDEVFVSSLERSITPDIKVAFVINANDNVLPKKIADDGLFNEKERHQLQQAGIKMAPDSRMRQLAENYLVYKALTRSGGRLNISYVLSDDQGGLLAASPLIRKVRELFPALSEQSYDDITSASALCGGITDLAELANRLSLARHGGEISQFWYAVYEYFAADPQYGRLFDQLRQGLVYRSEAGMLNSDNLSRQYGKKIRSSVSRLEKFRACPFAYFAAYGLKLGKRPEYKLEPADRGDLFHQVLADIGMEIAAKGLDWRDVDQDMAKEMCQRLLEKYLPQFLDGILASSARYQYFAERIGKTMVSTVLLMAEHMRGGSFVPIAWELPFGGLEGQLPPLSIELEQGKVLELHGKIDRVDLAKGEHNTWFRVVDYKTGKVTVSPKDIFLGLRMQLMVYLQVVMDNSVYFTADNAAAAGLYYAPVRDELYNSVAPAEANRDYQLTGITVKEEEAVLLADHHINGNSQLIKVAYSPKSGFYSNSPGMTMPQLQLMQQHLLTLLRETAGEMLGGIINASPLRQGSFDACAFCDHREVCGLDKEFAAPRNLPQPSIGEIWSELERGCDND